jgi:TPP-dependent pyruvate/acetoin dehydrogenase alpha subunit
MAAESQVPFDREALLLMYRKMVTIRRFEERVKQLYRGGEISGAIHLCSGQEAVAVGACAALRDDDYVTSTHRPHGHCLAKAWDVKRTMAEMMGRETGLSRGRGGSMHQFERSRGFLGGNGIVGGGIAIALGAAFAARYKRTDQVALGFFSEGASNQGVLHESLNLAALWKLPLIYLCENNRWAATTPVEKSTCTADIAPRAAAFGLPWQIVDGNSVLAVHAAVNEAVQRARSGNGTTFIEAKTYRVEPHCGIIADRRDPDELNRWRGVDHDPIARFEKRLIAGNEADRELLDCIQCEVEEALAQAVDFARQSPFPEPATVADSLWA